MAILLRPYNRTGAGKKGASDDECGYGVTPAEFLPNPVAVHNSYENVGYVETVRGNEWGVVDRALIGGSIMRDLIERDVPDTEPYQEILAVMGSIIVVVVGLTVLLSQGMLS